MNNNNNKEISSLKDALTKNPNPTLPSKEEDLFFRTASDPIRLGIRTIHSGFAIILHILCQCGFLSEQNSTFAFLSSAPLVQGALYALDNSKFHTQNSMFLLEHYYDLWKEPIVTLKETLSDTDQLYSEKEKVSMVFNLVDALYDDFKGKVLEFSDKDPKAINDLTRTMVSIIQLLENNSNLTKKVKELGIIYQPTEEELHGRSK